MKQYICVVQRYEHDDICYFSRVWEDETLEQFKNRMNQMFPASRDLYLAYSEWKNI